jgi:hypothetical protein
MGFSREVRKVQCAAWPKQACYLAFGNLPFRPIKTHTSLTLMPYLPQQSPPSGRRAERVRFEESTPVVLRFADGKRSSGQLQVISTTGGLLCLPQPLQPGAIGKLMFLINGGAVLGDAQMLSPMSWERQPFRFLMMHEDDRTRLQSAIQSRLAKARKQSEERGREREQMENFRAW